jgi:hypothetical protein
LLHFLKNIDRKIYLKVYVRERELTAFLASILKDVDNRLTTETGLSELPEIFGCKNEWDEILFERLEIAPSKKVAIERMIQELNSYMIYNERSQSSELSNDGYYNQYRKIAYDHYSSGENVTMLGLGYLLLKEEWKHNPKGTYPEEEMVKITNIPFDGVKHVLRALAEGATIAIFLPYLENLQSSETI